MTLWGEPDVQSIEYLHAHIKIWAGQ